MKTFGQTSPEETDIISRAKTREIVKVVLDYGLSQNQIYHMIYLLALELENAEHLKEITNFVSGMDKKSQKKSSIITEE